MMVYLVTDSGGAILRSGAVPNAETAALQAGTGETALIIEGSDGGFIDDVNVKVTSGVFAPVGGYAGDLPVATQLTVPE